MGFEINGSAPTVDDATPSALAYRYVLPEPTGRDGEGRPCGAVGRPSVELHFSRLSYAAWDYYVALVGAAPYVALSGLQVYNPWKSGGAGWETYTSALMHRPTFESMGFGSYNGVVILFTELTP